MRTCFLGAAAVLVLFGLGGLSADRSAAADPTAERDALLSTDREIATAARNGDMERIFDCWTDDAIDLFPGAPAARGKEAIRELIKRNRSRPGFSLRREPRQAFVSRSGDLGYTLGSFEISAEDAEGTPRKRRGNYLCVWKKQPDGAWKVAVGCGTFSAGGPSAGAR